MNKLDTIYSESKNPAQYARAYFNYLSELFESIDEKAIQSFIEIIIAQRNSGNAIYFIGNGGSAATASHFANDLSIGPRLPTKPIKAISLTDNMAVISAIGNDFGYNEIFTKQLECVLTKNDVVVAISASGNSPNIISAVQFAKKVGAKTVGLTGFDGGELRKISDLALHVQCKKGEYGPVEDLHMIFDHLVGTYLNRKLFENL